MLNLLRIHEVSFDDDFFILPGGKPIQYCSPGQRCSAMLPIVTLTSDAPIIIDQPEDNLDNRLVSRAIFKILSKLKETRQIILATHNPNILVSGDVEQVIVLKSNGSVEDYGSIDEPSIIQNVIDLMEGGKEALGSLTQDLIDAGLGTPFTEKELNYYGVKIPKIKDIPAKKIQTIRKKVQLSQSVFARLLNVSAASFKGGNWESLFN